MAANLDDLPIVVNRQAAVLHVFECPLSHRTNLIERYLTREVV